MKVRELIETLQKLNPEAEVLTYRRWPGGEWAEWDDYTEPVVHVSDTCKVIITNHTDLVLILEGRDA